ncbi:hypothetical protein CS009_00010 [Streptococcus macedonicus]|uniref:Uncharacterized protein n=1 Tax=Streptococcus macedonicus TaxID=59310 RepID=A0AAP8G062_STRMC|nr:hypothetical protein CS009_00010 [Streptococcus macedonicus]
MVNCVIGINLFLVMFCNSTITDLFLFVFTQLILHYQTKSNKPSICIKIIINLFKKGMQYFLFFFI